MNRTIKKRYVAALYCRLSKDDGNSIESMSISSQKMMLKQFADQQGISVYDYYIDDGYSGTNFDRPSFKRMIEDIENDKINCVITKDLSRLGRNYLESGTYIEMYFPEKRVRYIAVTDGIDTLNANDVDIMPFKNILNEMYAKDTSKKVKSALKTRMNEGKFIGSKAPFGYKKDPNDKHKLIIDKETSWIVELVYKLCLEGLGCKLIAEEMMKRKIPRPSAFVENADVKYGLTEENKYVWTHRMPLAIIRDRVYCGDLARNKRPSLSFKNDKRLYVPKEHHIVVENTHEGIVSDEIWKQAQEIIDNRKYTNERSDKYDNIFKGLIKCPTCGYAISPRTDYRLKRVEPTDHVCFSCSTYRKDGPKYCSMHKIMAKDLQEVVLRDIQHHGGMALSSKEDLVAKVLKKIGNDKTSEQVEQEKKLKLNQEELIDIDKAYERLYEDRLNQIISERNFELLNQKYQGKQNKLLKEIRNLESIKEEETLNKDDCDKFIENLASYAEIKELNRYILNQLIDVIYVYDPIEEDGEITQKVEIHYKFIGSLE